MKNNESNNYPHSLKRLIILKTLLLIAFFIISLQAQINTKVNLNFEDKINKWLTEYKVPAVGIGLIENGKIKYVKVFGELKKGIAAPDNAVFNIASMTKPVVAMLTLKLVEDGQWNLDEPLFHYWIDPDIANDPLHKKLTTRHVLTHQTGFPNWRKSNKLMFEFEPGTEFQYSGEGFQYLKRALEKKFNKPLDNLLDSIIFTPLGMNNTRYWTENLDMQKLARWHNENGEELNVSYETGVNAADDLLTTIEDYCKFMIYVMNCAGLSSNIYNDMICSQVSSKNHVGRGLGWEIVFDLPNKEYTLQHGGNDRGVNTMGIILPKSKRGAVTFTNSDNGLFICNNIIIESLDIGQEIIDYTYGAYLAPTIELPDDILESYVGTYLRSDVEGFKIHVTKVKNSLQLTGDAVPLMNLSAEDEDKFFAKGFAFQFEFIRDELNNVIKLNISENGKLLLDAKRINKK